MRRVLIFAILMVCVIGCTPVEFSIAEECLAGLTRGRSYVDPHLVTAARGYARFLADRTPIKGECLHSVGGRTSLERAHADGYAGSAVSECVAVGYDSVEDMYRGLMGSPPHRKCIESDHFDFGVGVIVDDGLYFGCILYGNGPWVRSGTFSAFRQGWR